MTSTEAFTKPSQTSTKSECSIRWMVNESLLSNDRGLRVRYRYCRPDLGRWTWLVSGEVRSFVRQPPVRRYRHRGGHLADREHRRTRRSLLGSAWRGRQFRRGHLVRVPTASRRPGPSGAGAV